ncbi:HNH endonuclease signature motif containing protein [Micrococcus lylae]|uniref:HNH endonuclease signature motif containing protein n=1 Tax=Micrococcus lylae TaxID=1273 RepID=UPI000AFD91C5|nr:HNH endonuclease signature motif containing protein [Micrococcus lylae]
MALATETRNKAGDERPPGTVRPGSLRDRRDPRARHFPNMPMAHEVAVAQRLADHVVRRLEGPDWWATGEQEDLPELISDVERLARTVAAAQAMLAGHVAKAHENEADREEILGVPRGKSAHRDAADYLRSTLRVDRREAKRRIARAAATREQQAFVTAPVTPPQLPAVAATMSRGHVDPAAGDVVVKTLTEARTDARLAGVPDTEADAMIASADRLLSEQLTRLDADSIRRLCQRWRQNVDAVVMPDHGAPTEAELNAAQGMFYRGRRRGLHRWELLVTDAQNEVLQTLASAATNPRADREAGGGRSSSRAAAAPHTDLHTDPHTDPRTRGQKQADTVISALQSALAHAGSEVLPSSGGHRPQLLVTIDYETLLRQVSGAVLGADGTGADPAWTNGTAPGWTNGTAPGRTDGMGAAGVTLGAGVAGVAFGTAHGRALSCMDFTGPVDPRQIRRIACDADIIPAVLGGEGEILDLGRARRLFTRAQRKAITARDGGCAAPGCTIPAAWCEVHHIDHWEHGGPTDVDNGVLLCSHHHHAVHSGWWEIDVEDGVPWFTPARHLDPDRTPRRNQYHRTRGHPRHE